MTHSNTAPMTGASRESIGRRFLTHLDTLAEEVEGTLEMASNKLEKLCLPEEPITEKEEKEISEEDTYPPYFHETRLQLQRIEYVNNRLRKILEAVEV